MDKNTNLKSVEIRLKFYLGLTTSQAQNNFESSLQILFKKILIMDKLFLINTYLRKFCNFDWLFYMTVLQV